MNVKNYCMACDAEYYAPCRKDSYCSFCMEGENRCEGEDCAGMDIVATHEHDGKHYCDNCYEYWVFTCEDCGNLHKEGLVYVGDNAAGIKCHYCVPCAFKDLFQDLEITDQIILVHFARAAITDVKSKSGTDLQRVMDEIKQVLLNSRESQEKGKDGE